MTMRRVLVTGAGGFIGGAVLAALQEAGRGRVVIRSLTRAPAVDGAQEHHTGDLSRPETLRGATDGADVLVHLASRVSGTEAECTAVNLFGTRELLNQARRSGVRRIVHLSTAAVYGAGPHRGISVDQVVPAPVSPASRTRLAAEAEALAAGATVLRPGLVLGPGDRWVVPALAELTRRVPARWDDGNARLSLVEVHDLARLIAALALGAPPCPAGVYHASQPEPVRIQDLLDALASHGVLAPAPDRSWSWHRCLDELRRTPGEISERQFHLLAQDHWYRSDEIWTDAGVRPGPGVPARLAGAASWYRRHLAAAGSTTPES